ncbi:MAG: pantoate--beta-alanine ligase [Pelagibacteraceae bacterium]|nr:pantoate--beta-alanine ligase [Pelagibacteraceae bacterium]
MKFFKNKKKLCKEIKGFKNIGFIPTLGGLHKGHEALIKKSIKISNKTLVSIFLNPKQFENKKDFKNYPKNYKNDIRILKKLKVDYVYMPSYRDVYKFKTKNKIILDKFSKKLCGKYRKGHFRGVIDVVNRFLEIIKPKKILLGHKDFQQLVLIKKHIKKNKIKTTVISCKTVRDKNFIAYSSRLKKLKKQEKNNLVKIIKYLKYYKRYLILNKKMNVNFLKIKNKLSALGVKKVDYVELIDLKTLEKPKKNKIKFNLFFAFYIGEVRIIDNF